MAHQRNIFSLETLKNSIRTDSHTFRWFLHLCLQPSLAARTDWDAQDKRYFSRLKSSRLLQKILHSLLFVSVIISAVYSAPFALGIVALIIIFLSLLLQRRKKYAVVSIASKMVSRDYEITVLQKTSLFQVSEKYSREYHIPSLVDVIYNTDKILRPVIFFLAAFVCLIWPFDSFCQALIIVFILYYLAVAILKTDILYRHFH